MRTRCENENKVVTQGQRLQGDKGGHAPNNPTGGRHDSCPPPKKKFTEKFI